MLRTPAAFGRGTWEKPLFSSEHVLAPDKPAHRLVTSTSISHLVTSTAFGNSCQQEGRAIPLCPDPRTRNQAGKGAGEDAALEKGRDRAAFRHRREREGAAPAPGLERRARRPGRWQTPPNKALAGGTAGSGREAGTEPRLEHGSPVAAAGPQTPPGPA